MTPEHKFETIEELLPSFIDFLKTMPCIYDSDGPNAWENWIDEPEMHLEDGMCDVRSVLCEWASLHIKKHLKVRVIRENWINTTDEGYEALEDHRDYIERDEELPESIYPPLETMADLFITDLIDEAHQEAYKLNSDREEEAASRAEEEQEREHAAEIIDSLVPIAPPKTGIHNSVTFMATALTDELYAKITIEDTYVSSSLSNFTDTFYVPISPAELATFQLDNNSRSIIIDLMPLSKGRDNIHSNEHGVCFTEKVYHPHV